MRSQPRIDQRPPDGSDAREASRLEALGQLALLDTPPEPEFDRVARLIRNIYGVSISIVSMIDSHRQWYKACIGMPVSEVPRADSFCTLTIREMEPVIAPDATKDPRFADNPYVTHEPHIRFYAGMPLRTAAGHVIGTLCAIDYEPRPFGAREIEILRDLADIVMAEIELRQLASTDVLTGALSRRAFKEEGAIAAALSQRHGNQLSCIAVDLDHFKSVNDTHGHAAGDKVLAAAAAAIRESLRVSDRIARIGGEEFAILLPHTGLAQALEVADKLREKIAATSVDIGAVRIGITASFGVAELDSATGDIDTLLAHADTALYEAKFSGRNRCTAWQGVNAGMAVRERVLKGGKIRVDGRRDTIDCTVRSLSLAGAGLDLSSATDVPSHFRLAILGEAREQPCRVRERSERHLDVEFLDQAG